ncbi:unnamed protein product [Ectocarpus sp. CCAP 1310/34]|nr:unnamed protein product [Ectocarpus sp. CCAP 1310/34]
MDEWSTLEGLGLATAQLTSLARRGSFSRDDGVSIEFCNFCQENAKHHVLLLTGWDESFLKYGDVISELLQAGINVYAMDWRSQGLSGRHLLDPQVTYVESFDDHLDDLSFFVNQVVVESCGVRTSQLTCLAHSMGGLLSLMAAAGDRGLFQRLVVCSPMIMMKCGMPHFVALWLGRLFCRLGMGSSYAPVQSGVDVSRPITMKLTTDKARLATWERIRRAYPIVAMGGMSNLWVVEAIKAQNWFRARAKQVSVPVLLLEAGVDVFVCTSRPFRELCRAVPSCRRLCYPTTYHEILFEKEWARSHAMKATITFLKSGEYPAPGETTVITPPRLSEEARQKKMKLLLVRFCYVVMGAGLGVAGVAFFKRRGSVLAVRK